MCMDMVTLTSRNHYHHLQRSSMITAHRKDGRIFLASTSFPEERLTGWIAFYERMATKYNRDSYREAVTALRAIG